jgi:predicted nucleic acid-binding protein
METTPAVADTGFVVALLNRLDTMHNNVTTVYIQQKQILLPQTVLAEVAYLVGRNAGSATLVAFLKGISPVDLF